MKEKSNSTIDPEEVARFSRIAHEWWNPEGKFKPLHRINPLRIGYILDRIRDSGFGIQGSKLLDIGCGGGLICEPMARLGATVTGIDASEKNIAVAKLHAEQSGLEIDYRCVTAEELGDVEMWRCEDVKTPPPHISTSSHPPYDIVLALEIVEHVADVEAFVAAACTLLKPGGLIIFSTLNRTAKSFALAIVGAEYILRWLPRGTHTWSKFLRPHELCAQLRRNHIDIQEMTGMVMHPLTGQWRLDKADLSVNYLVVGRKAIAKT